MNSYVVVAFVACLAAANASWLHGPSAHVLQGPSSKTTLVGPEGSVISAVAPGGQIVHEEHPGVVAHAAPVLAHAVPATVVAHPSAYEHDKVVLAAHAPVVAIAHGDLDVHGHEGQYVHDYSETLYDDGSYKPHLYHH